MASVCSVLIRFLEASGFGIISDWLEKSLPKKVQHGRVMQTTRLGDRVQRGKATPFLRQHLSHIRSVRIAGSTVGPPSATPTIANHCYCLSLSGDADAEAIAGSFRFCHPEGRSL